MNTIDTFGAQRNLSALVDFSNFINSSLDLKFILNNLLLTCFGKFHTTKGFVALFDSDDKLRIKASKGISEEIIGQFPNVPLCDKTYDNALLAEFCDKLKFVFYQDIISSQGLRGIIFLGERLTKGEYLQEDRDFLNTLINIAATAIENSIIVEKLKEANRNLDSKVAMLTSLFELSKEFSGVLEASRVGKLLVYSVIGQLMVTSYAVVLCGGKEEAQIIEAKIQKKILQEALKKCDTSKITSPLFSRNFPDEFLGLKQLGVELIIPMQIQGETKGLMLLGKRFNNQDFTESDVEFIYATGSLAIISIENAKLFKEALEKQKMEEDLEIARGIQKNLFPQRIPKMKNFEIAAVNISSKQVGGDYYDLVKFANNSCLFAIGDVSGKGVPASLLMANLQAFLKSICKQGMELDQATNVINDLISENTVMGNFITFFWGIINDETKMLTYVNAGHNPPLLIRNGEILKLTKGGMILGVMKTIVPYVSQTLPLYSDDVLILFTDGVTEAMNKQMEEFSDEKLEEIVLEAKNKSANDILFHIKAEVERFVDGANQSDDITLLIIKVK
ncbi:MAG: SpoIIE family protein phosphatase [Bacteroidota bacterium]|nr:SpoIIE family protein phosphatase [Bacteroidota bacterium]MDP4191124.1 SpoIIE family protein phosphatase [Bacteroidota bacterium]MDP4193470.1 SpoIIE family protein phosphatase [Bacteroidota bacterium]